MKVILIILSVFILLNCIVFYITTINQQQKIDIVLNKSIENLKTHIDILLYHEKSISDNIYKETINTKGFIELISKANNSSKEQQNILREKCINLFNEKYLQMKNRGVLQYHFVLANNNSFLRMHNQKKYGDNLSEFREDYIYVQEKQKTIRGFVKGRTIHGFRNTYPIFDKNKNYIGAMEISFDSDKIQKYLNQQSKLHTHFIVHKSFFDTIENQTNIYKKYVNSAEHNDYFISLNGNHSLEMCVNQNNLKLKENRKYIDKMINKGKNFSFYNKDRVVTFISIKNIKNTKVVAWFVAYKDNIFIKNTITNTYYIQIIFFIILIIIAYLTYLKIEANYIIDEEKTLLNSVLNLTNDIIFITNFKEVFFSNSKFLDFFNINNLEEFNKKIDNDFLTTFVHIEGYLYDIILKENETFPQLVERTPELERIVCILDKHISPQAFSLSLTEIYFNDDINYLVTLTDITSLKEKEQEITSKAYYDNLTQVYNRNKFDEIVSEEIIRAKRYKTNLTIGIIDIDHFKKFNDTYGHLIGDEILKMLANYLNTHVRDTDTFARWGGEEFVVLFPETSIENAQLACDKLRIGLSKLSHKKAGNITASFGITQYKLNDSLEDMFKRCDDALYKAKADGRNIVCINR
ncbi:MAG: diguanylate cyclase [Campylobacterota bacterium]|nr:diguanylate cyclase [Campylobacterota bacterium]